MITSENHAELRRIAERAQEGTITAARAVSMAVARGYLAIGTALSRENYVPGVALTFTSEDGWHPIYVNERKGTVPILRAGKVGMTTLWAALGGDVNQTFQRLVVGRSILPENRLYDQGSQGWQYDDQKGVYSLWGHTDLVRVARELDATTVIGEIDFVRDVESDKKLLIPNEPGHFGLLDGQETIATAPVRGGDIQALLDAVSIEVRHYEPLRI